MSRIHGIEHHYPTHINAVITIAARLKDGTANELDIVAANELYYECSLCASLYDWLGPLAGSDGVAGIDCAREFLETWQNQQRNTEASDDHDLSENEPG